MSRYELIERIGCGGMAEVFRGRAIGVGGFIKPVAIKRILPHLGRDPRFVEMLIAEANTLARLRQRNVVQIYDVGVGDDGQHFLVMEYVEGRDLSAIQERLERDRDRFPLDLGLHVGAEVCDALEHAHRLADDRGRPAGLIHRDVSPSNVLLSLAGEVKLTDFGIAKKLDTARTETLKGKFAYMSPEQAQVGQLDPTTDVYSLGIVLYELFLGTRLFSAMKDFDALRAVREGRVPRPRAVDPMCPPEVEEILMRALATEPRARWRSAGEMGGALRAYRYSAATSAGEPTKAISSLLHRLFPSGSASSEAETSMVRIRTVAGFVAEGSPPAPVPAPLGDADPWSGRPAPRLPGVDVALDRDDLTEAETRVRRAPAAQHAVHGGGRARDDEGRSFRLPPRPASAGRSSRAFLVGRFLAGPRIPLWVGIVLAAVLAIVGYLTARGFSPPEPPAELIRPAGAAVGTGESLPGPTMKPPVRRRH